MVHWLLQNLIHHPLLLQQNPHACRSNQPVCLFLASLLGLNRLVLPPFWILGYSKGTGLHWRCQRVHPLHVLWIGCRVLKKGCGKGMGHLRKWGVVLSLQPSFQHIYHGKIPQSHNELSWYQSSLPPGLHVQLWRQGGDKASWVWVLNVPWDLQDVRTVLLGKG